MSFCRAMIHRIEHLFKWNKCILESAPDALYTVCTGCGKRKYFAAYMFERAGKGSK